jgi:hypothetical protein
MKAKSMVLIGAMVFCCTLTASTPVVAQDNGNGTVTVGGKVWLKDVGCLGWRTWTGGSNQIASLSHGRCGLTDNSKPGDWRYPNTDELLGVFSSYSLFVNVYWAWYWTGDSAGGSDKWGCYAGRPQGCLPMEEMGSLGVWPVRKDSGRRY